jgi:hypothetical protein
VLDEWNTSMVVDDWGVVHPELLLSAGSAVSHDDLQTQTWSW